MIYFKSFIAVCAVAITFDVAAYEGHYTRYWGERINHAAHEVGTLHWTGFIR